MPNAIDTFNEYHRYTVHIVLLEKGGIGDEGIMVGWEKNENHLNP
jgi:hypothetical protein